MNLTNLVLTETLPANTSFNAAASSAGWSCAGATCTLNVGNLVAGATRTAIFAVAVDTPLPAGTTQIDNSAAIVDNTTGANDGASDSTPVNATPAMTLTKSDGGAATTPGGTVVYSLS